MWQTCVHPDSTRESCGQIGDSYIKSRNRSRNHSTTRGQPTTSRFAFTRKKISVQGIVSVHCLFIYSMPKPTVLVLGHSFVRHLKHDIRYSFDSRAKADFDLGRSTQVYMQGVGGRTVQKLREYDMFDVEKVRPDIVILEIGANDLAKISPELVGSAIDDLVDYLMHHRGVRVVGVCQVIGRRLVNKGLEDDSFNRKAAILNQYLSVVLAQRSGVFLWQHKELAKRPNFLLRDGVHLNTAGEYHLYRSYRGAILKAIKLLNIML